MYIKKLEFPAAHSASNPERTEEMCISSTTLGSKKLVAHDRTERPHHVSTRSQACTIQIYRCAKSTEMDFFIAVFK